MEKRKIIKQIIDHYKDAEKTALVNFKNKWQLLFSIILSAQTTDKQVNKATKILFKKFKKLESYSVKNFDKILEIVKVVGLSKKKSENLIKTAKILKQNSNLKKIKNYKFLISLPGVGPKTANVFLGLTQETSHGIPVDTHVFRVANRIGLIKTNSIKNAQTQLEKLTNKSNYFKVNFTFIKHGRTICLSKKPKCSICFLKKTCQFYKNLKMEDHLD